MESFTTNVEMLRCCSNFNDVTVLYSANGTSVSFKFEMRTIALNANEFANFQCNHVEYYVYVK